MSRQSKNTRNRAHAKQYVMGSKGPAQTLPVHGKAKRQVKEIPSKVTMRLRALALANPACVVR